MCNSKESIITEVLFPQQYPINYTSIGLSGGLYYGVPDTISLPILIDFNISTNVSENIINIGESLISN